VHYRQHKGYSYWNRIVLEKINKFAPNKPLFNSLTQPYSTF
jgi:hypothetical protein